LDFADREVFKDAILTNATGVLFIYNYLSGNQINHLSLILF
jgi:hypothetical protein